MQIRRTEANKRRALRQALQGNMTLEEAQQRYIPTSPRTDQLDYENNGHPWEYISTARLIQDTINLLAPQIPPDAVGIAGIPRSGMLPATLLSQLHHLPLYELSPQSGLHPVGHGSRGWTFKLGEEPRGPLIVIDDTVYGGAALHRARSQLEGLPAMFGAVYVRPEMRDLPDFFSREVPSPHLLEWNLFNNGPFAGYAANPCMKGGVACDFDGVLCENPQMTDIPAAPYEEWLPAARPLYTPRMHPIPLIVTFRLEKYRQQTLQWLDRHKIRCKKLIMYPADKPHQRQWGPEFKGDAYLASGCNLFIESEPWQALEIAAYTDKPVLCPRTGKIYY